jgi:hypothetical protein
MNTKNHEHPETSNMTLRKTLVILSLVIAGSLAANSAYSQVRVNVGIGAPAPVIYERDYPGYTYYTYPAWHGHYRDRYYYAHYRPAFEREHRAYFAGRRFDHERYERENHWQGGHGDRRGEHGSRPGDRH